MHCDDTLKNQIKFNLQKLDVVKNVAEKSAAVALIVVEQGFGADLSDLPHYEKWQQTSALILTRRSMKLRNHPGQWALPGGRIDEGESALDAAKREALEEIGLSLDRDSYLGQLDDFMTRSGFLISPLVFWGGKADDVQRNPDEVESIHRIPTSELLRSDAPMLDYDEIVDDRPDKLMTDAGKSPVLRMPIGDNWIAAPTAAMLYQFREVCLLGNQTRVGHFDEPRFAWK